MPVWTSCWITWPASRRASTCSSPIRPPRAPSVASARAELAVQVSAAKKDNRPTGAASPTRRRKSSGQASGSSPIRTRTGPAGGQRRRSSGAGGGAELAPLELLLQNLALVLPAARRRAGGRRQAAGGPSWRRRWPTAPPRSTTRPRNVQEWLEAAAAAQLSDGRRALLALRDSVLAERPVRRRQPGGSRDRALAGSAGPGGGQGQLQAGSHREAAGR